MISDEFLATYFNIANLMMAQMISMIRLMTGEYERKDFFFYWSGAEVQIEKPYVPSLHSFIHKYVVSNTLS